jgi:hypothetical protein
MFSPFFYPALAIGRSHPKGRFAATPCHWEQQYRKGALPYISRSKQQHPNVHDVKAVTHNAGE